MKAKLLLATIVIWMSSTAVSASVPETERKCPIVPDPGCEVELQVTYNEHGEPKSVLFKYSDGNKYGHYFPKETAKRKNRDVQSVQPVLASPLLYPTP